MRLLSARLFEGMQRRKATGLAAASWAVFAVVLASSACGGSEPEPPRPPYQLTHTAADAEFAIGWDSIVAACPDVVGLQKVEAFVRRGEEVPIGPDGTLKAEVDDDAAWKSQRFAASEGAGGSRRIQVRVSFVEKRGLADEQVRLTAQRTSAAAMMIGAAGGMKVSVEEGDGFVFARLDSDVPIKSEQRFVAADNMLIHIIQTVRAGPAQLCGFEKLDELAREAGRNAAHVTVAAIP